MSTKEMAARDSLGNKTAFVPVPQPAVQGIFEGRSKRFLVSCRIQGKSQIIHSNNTGSMLGLTKKGLPVLASYSANPKRKLPYTQEAVYLGSQDHGFWVGVNTSVPNRMLAQAHACGCLPAEKGYVSLRREVVRNASRLDGLLEGEGLPRLWVECKNVTLVEDDIAIFPDAVSQRAVKHLHELTDIVLSGERAAMFYLVQRPDARCFGPADCIDPDYAAAFWEAVDKGVEIWAYHAIVTPQGVTLAERLPLACRP